MGLGDPFMPMVRPVPRVGVVTKDDLAQRASTTLNREELSLFELSNAQEAIRVINGETKKGAMMIITSETTPDLDKIVDAFLASTQERVHKLMVITSKAQDYGKGIETMPPDDALKGSLNQVIKRIDREKGGDRSIRPLFHR